MKINNGNYLAGLSIHALNDRIDSCTRYIMELDKERVEHVRSLEITKYERDKRYTISLIEPRYIEPSNNYSCSSWRK